jgi:ribosomal protein S18 acetylase RimI-like enzyme
MNEIPSNTPEREAVTSSSVRTEVYRRYFTPWRRIKESITAIDRAAFGKKRLGPDFLKAEFRGRNHTAVLLRDKTRQILGYATARPIGKVPRNEHRSAENKKTAYVSVAAIDPPFQGQGLSIPLFDALADALRARGYEYVELDARREDGFADTLSRRYNDVIETQRPSSNRYLNESMLFLRLRLSDQTS